MEVFRQVNEIASLLSKNTSPSGGFVHHQDLPPVDLWGNFLKVTYAQVWATEILTVRSAGPDQHMDSDDDLVRVMEMSNPAGILSGIPTSSLFLSGWLWFGLLACACSSLLCRGRRRTFTACGGEASMNNTLYNRRSPVARYFIALLAGPLAFAFWGYMLACAAWNGRQGSEWPNESTGNTIIRATPEIENTSYKTWND